MANGTYTRFPDELKTEMSLFIYLFIRFDDTQARLPECHFDNLLFSNLHRSAV